MRAIKILTRLHVGWSCKIKTLYQPLRGWNPVLGRGPQTITDIPVRGRTEHSLKLKGTGRKSGGVPPSRCWPVPRLGRKRWIFDQLPGRRRCSREKSKFREKRPGTFLLSLQRSKNRSKRISLFLKLCHHFCRKSRPADPWTPDMLLAFAVCYVYRSAHRRGAP